MTLENQIVNHQRIKELMGKDIIDIALSDASFEEYFTSRLWSTKDSKVPLLWEAKIGLKHLAEPLYSLQFHFYRTLEYIRREKGL
jgi:hypothetical protein